MAINLTDNVRVTSDKPSDDKYLNTEVSPPAPYASVAAACLKIPIGQRHIGLTVRIGPALNNSKEYHWDLGTADNQLILKTVEQGITEKTGNLLFASENGILSGNVTATAFNNFLAAARTAKKVAYFPEGTYTVDGVINPENVEIMGAGINKTNIKLNNDNGSTDRQLFLLPDTKGDCKISHLTIDANYAGNPNCTTMGWQCGSDSFNLSFKKVRFTGGAGVRAVLRFYALPGQYTERVRIEDCEFIDNERTCIEMRGLKDCIIKDSYFTSWGVGNVNSPAIQLQSTSNFDIKILHNTFDNTVGVQFAIESTTAWMYSVVIDGNTMNDPYNLGGNGISGYFQDSIFTNNVMSGGLGNQRSGLEIFGSNHLIANNTVTRGACAITSGNSLQGSSRVQGNIRFINNSVKTGIDNCAALFISGVGNDPETNITCIGILVHGNILDARDGGGNNSPAVCVGRYGAIGTAVEDITVTDNKMYTNSTSGNVRFEALVGNKIIIQDNYMLEGNNPLVYITDTFTNVTFSANDIQTTSKVPFYAVPTTHPFKTSNLILPSDRLYATDFGLNNTGGVLNTQTVVQAFLNQCFTDKKIAFFPAGTYVMEGGNFAYTGTVVKGAGMLNTILKLEDNAASTPANHTIFKITNTITNVEVSDLTMDANYANNPNRTVYPFHIEHKTKDINIFRVLLKGAKTYATLRINAIYGTAGEERCQNLRIRDCRFEDSGSGLVTFTGVQNVVFEGNYLKNWGNAVNSASAINLQGVENEDVKIVNNTFENLVANNWAISGINPYNKNVLIDNNLLSDINNLGGNGISGYFLGAVITNNSMIGGNGSQKSGITAYGNNIRIQNNHLSRGFLACGLGSLISGAQSNIRIYNNFIKTAVNDAAGLYVTGNATEAISDVHIAGNKIDTSGNSGNSPCINIGTQGVVQTIVKSVYMSDNTMFAASSAACVRLECAAGSEEMYLRANNFLAGANPISYRFNTINGVYLDNNYAKTTSTAIFYAEPASPAFVTITNSASDTNVVHTSGDESIGGIKTFSDVTDSASTTTGAVRIAGGLGVAKKVTAKQFVGTDYAGTGYRVLVANPSGGLETPYNVILPYVEDTTIITQLTTEANWDATNAYVGSAIVGGNQGQYHHTTSWYYLFVDDFTPIRISKGKLVHLKGLSGAPTIATGASAGSSPTASVTGTDLSGTITVTTGTSPTANGTIATLTYNRPFSVAPRVVLTPANAAANALSGGKKVYVPQASVTTSACPLAVGATALDASTQYVWNYTITE